MFILTPIGKKRLGALSISLGLQCRVGTYDVDDDSLGVVALFEGVKRQRAPSRDPEVVGDHGGAF